MEECVQRAFNKQLMRLISRLLYVIRSRYDTDSILHESFEKHKTHKAPHKTTLSEAKYLDHFINTATFRVVCGDQTDGFRQIKKKRHECLKSRQRIKSTILSVQMVMKTN